MELPCCRAAPSVFGDFSPVQANRGGFYRKEPALKSAIMARKTTRAVTVSAARRQVQKPRRLKETKCVACASVKVKPECADRHREQKPRGPYDRDAEGKLKGQFHVFPLAAGMRRTGGNIASRLNFTGDGHNDTIE